MYAKNIESRNKPPQTPQKPKQTRSNKDTLRIYGSALLLAIVAFTLAFQFVGPAPTKSLTIATGQPDGAYYHFAHKMKQQLAIHGIELKIRSTSGSMENLELLKNEKNDVQVAFIQSGAGNAESYPELIGLGSVYLEPLWVFTRLPQDVTHLGQLRGKKVATGNIGSGTHAIVQQLLHDNSLEDDIIRHNIGGSDAIDALIKGDVDALITVASYQAKTIQTLLNTPEINLMSFQRAQAYAQRYGYLSRVELPEGSIDLASNIPQQNIQLIALAATLVARNDLHPALSDLLLQTAATIFGKANLFADMEEFPSPRYLDYPVSSEAQRFYKSGPPFLQRFMPFWAATLIDRLKVLILPLIALLLPLSKILPPTYRWSIRKKIYRWYDELQIIDQSAEEKPNEENLELCLANLDKMEQEVREVEVPLGYAQELYILRQHIDLLARQISIEEQIAEKARLDAQAHQFDKNELLKIEEHM